MRWSRFLVLPAAKSQPDFLLSVPAGEDSLAHRRHVRSQLILQSRDSLTDRLDLENFLGIERLFGRICSAARKTATLGNVRLLRMETSYAVRYLLAAGAVETFYLLFPDPWPKRRHHRRRIVTPDFLSSIHAAFRKNGIIYIATDHLDYFEKIKEVAHSNPGFAVADLDIDLPPSRFALIFQQKGAPVHRLALRKVSPVQ